MELMLKTGKQHKLDCSKSRKRGGFGKHELPMGLWEMSLEKWDMMD